MMEKDTTNNEEAGLPPHDPTIPAQEVQPAFIPSQNQPNGPYVWANNDSMFSNDIDRWIRGDIGSQHHAMPRPNRFETSPRSTMTSPSVPAINSEFWYVAALMLPLLSFNRCRSWRCTTSSILNAFELLLTQVAGYCDRARSRLRRFSRQQGARELFAGAMDIILVVYALGFLLISMYQASLFQHI